MKKGKFLKVLNEAVRIAGSDYLVTLGIRPTRPETGYGYLKTSKMRLAGKMINKVERFTEKPDLAKARKFIKSRNYYWNSGMFIWKVSAVLDAFNRHLPSIYRLIGRQSGPAHIKKVWGRLPSISIDYGILEKASNVAAVPAVDIGWSDLGSWESLTEVLSKNKQGNILRGRVHALNCRDSILWTDKKLVAAVGLDNVVIVNTPDAVLVCRKDRSQDVKYIVALLEKNKQSEI
jgi:mannose-1-phosphate guanylyltransferase/mannose-6-phosphate isomerase